MPTCAQAIKEVFKNKDQILTAKQIIDAVEKKYPDKWKDVTIRTHTIGCSVELTQGLKRFRVGIKSVIRGCHV